MTRPVCHSSARRFVSTGYADALKHQASVSEGVSPYFKEETLRKGASVPAKPTAQKRPKSAVCSIM